MSDTPQAFTEMKNEIQKLDPAVSLEHPEIQTPEIPDICHQSNRKVALVGLGYVGLPLALLANRKGHKVLGIDIDESKIAKIKQQQSPFQDEEIATQLAQRPLEVSTSFENVKQASVIVICVPTPVDADNNPDLEPVREACRSIAPHIKPGQLIILESTVNPGVSEETVLPILEELSGLRGGKDFFLAHCPERINPGDAVWNVENINRVVGGLTENSLRMAVDFYRNLISGKVHPMKSIRAAEAVKMVENAFRDVNIAFVNELAMAFSRIGIDILDVIEGASTKPFAFMPHTPGCGVGGHCIPVDPHYLIDLAGRNGFDHRILKLAREINDGMPEFAVDKLTEALEKRGVPAKQARVSVLGLAYKPEIDDTRNSPSFKIVQQLSTKVSNVKTFDPFVPALSSAESLEDATSNIDAIVLATAHRVFTELDMKHMAKNGVKVILDGRNCLDKMEIEASGMQYVGIGR